MKWITGKPVPFIINTNMNNNVRLQKYCWDKKHKQDWNTINPLKIKNKMFLPQIALALFYSKNLT